MPQAVEEIGGEGLVGDCLGRMLHFGASMVRTVMSMSRFLRRSASLAAISCSWVGRQQSRRSR